MSRSSHPRPELPPLAPSQQPDEIGRLGRCRVLRVLAVGGMGFILEAEDGLLGRRVALKVLKREARDDARERFLREARAAAAISHDNVVAIHHVDEETIDGQRVPYLVMPLL